MHNKNQYCRNCGAELHGEFCSSCGQRDNDIHVPVKELASEFLGILPAFDVRLLRTIKPFLFRPGFLTREYLSGKRKQYISPFKFYFFISFLFFFLSSLNDSEGKKNLRNSMFESDSLSAVVNGDSTAVSIRNPSSGVSFTISDTAQVEELFGKNIIEGFKSGKRNPRMFFDLMKEHMPKIIFLLLPVFALLLKLVYVRSRLLYIQHLIFSFYFHSFIFFVLFSELCVEMVTPKSFRLYENVFYLAIPVYLFAGLRNVYQQSWWKTSIKFLLLSMSHVLVFIFTLSFFVIITIYLFFT